MKFSQRLTHRLRGFTIIELLVVLAILGVLSTALLPLGEALLRAQQERELRLALWEIRNAIDAYKDAAEQGRVVVAADASGYPPDLKSLYAGVQDASKPDAQLLYFMRRLPRDPFYPDGSASAEDTWGLRAYASPPDAPAPGEDVFDVYSLSKSKGLNGVPYRDW